MKILHVVASLDSKDGGAISVVLELTRSLAKSNIEVSIFAPSLDDPKEEVKSYHGVKIRYFEKGYLSRFWSGYSSSLAKALMEEAPKFDLIHTHGIWYYPHFAAHKAAKCAKKPHVITVHGELNPWILKHRAFFKKRIHSLVVQSRIFREASAIQAVSKNEAKDIVKFTVNPNIFIIPNGINLEEFEKPVNKSQFFNVYPQLRGKKIILFLGRINAGKGLETLVKAFARVIKIQADARLLIVGPDEWKYKPKIEKIIKRKGLLDKITFTGILTGNEKLAALNCADIFVLPSESEGFSMSILEAMMFSLPVIISPQCNFPEVEQEKAGRIVDNNIEQLAKNLIGLLNHPEVCKEMGKRGRELVKEKFSWDRIADEMVKVYKKIIDKQGLK